MKKKIKDDPKVEETKETKETPETELVEEPEETAENQPEEKPETGEDSKVAELTEQLLRLQADFQNFRNRTAREKEDTVRFATESLITKLIDVFDDFDRALAAEKEHDAFYDGVAMIFDRMKKILEAQGLEVIDTDGAEFDPNLHHAVLSEESDTVESGHIIEAFQKGYKLKGRVIRPAMVKVAK